MGMRDEWITLITKLADPVLTIFVERRQDMPAQGDATRTHFMYLEALGRLLCGMAPWLELGGDDTEEGKLRQKYAEMAREAIDAATVSYTHLILDQFFLPGFGQENLSGAYAARICRR